MRSLRYSPLASRARRAALVWTAGVLGVATLAGGVRVLPWVLAEDVPARVALVFARSLFEAALEVALLVGWPVGFAMAARTFVERGEARVLLLLGERPRETALGLAPLGAAFALALFVAGFLAGQGAREPGRVANALVLEARASCAGARAPRAVHVPFVNASWLCPPAREFCAGSDPDCSASPRLYLIGPGNLPVTGSSLELAGDLRSLEIDAARVVLGLTRVSARSLVVRGLTPWGAALALDPAARGLLLALAALAAALASVTLVLARLARSRWSALLVGAAGPIAVLGAMRALDRAHASALAYLTLPLASIAGATVAALLVSRLLRAKRSCRV